MSTSQLQVTPDVTGEIPFVFACPSCRSSLEAAGPNGLYCPVDGQSFHRLEGIWRMVLPERASYFQKFMRDYEAVRRAEGRGSDDPQYYRALPFADCTGRFTDDWRIRATSFQAFVERVVEPLERRRSRPLKVLDIGAGNGWLANRLAQRGHQVAAIDLLTNGFDGLGAHVHYETRFEPVQAEFDRLPFADGQADLIVFNGSLHYSTSYPATLGEALRVLRPDGFLAIIDTPVYRDPASGEAMVREREADFVRRYGFPSNSIPAENYLTHDRLDNLALTLGIEWRKIEPNYGLSWSLRPWRARVRGRREPAKFPLIAGKRGRSQAGEARSLKRVLGRRWLRGRYLLSQRHRHNNLVIEEIAGCPFVVLPEVFNPKLFRTGSFLAGLLDERLIPAGSTVLDMGSGSGVGAVAAARWASWVVAVDINPAAVRCTRVNALLNEVEEKVEARHGDLFAPVSGERFDVVLFNPPFYRGVPKDAPDHAWRSVDVVERFASELADHLTPAGYALVILSSDGDSQSFLETFRASGLAIDVIARRDLVNETLTVYRLSPKG